MLSGILIKTTLVDYPARVAATWFLCGCNIRCPYCYNGELVLNNLAVHDAVYLKEVYEHLNKRKNVLSGFVLSGGEALIHSEIPKIISSVKAMGYKVKIDTNGLLPDKLKTLFKSPNTKPDFIAIDIKTAPDRYALLGYENDATPLLEQSISIASALPASCFEFRTVLVPPLVTKDDIEAMAKLLPKDSVWHFAPFRSENCLDPSYNEITAYTDREMGELVEFAKKFVPNATLR